MTQPISTRAGSLAASSALLAVLVLAAVSARIPLLQLNLFTPPPIVMERETPPPKPPEPARAQQIEKIAPIEEIALPRTIDTNAPQIETIETYTIDSGLTDQNDGQGEALRVITDPRWLRRPADLEAYYPRRARLREREGAVTLDCLVGVDGRLSCAIASETPEGWGFGEAALRIAQDHRMAPATENGAPVSARYRMRVPFTLLNSR